MNTAPTTTPKPRRRWFQFSLRTLLVLMLLFGCGFGWLASKIKRAREQKEAVKAIQELGGRANFRRDWLGNLLGQDLGGVNAVSLNNTRVTDAGLAHLRGLTSLKQLYLDNTKVTDAGLVQLRGLTQLQNLSLASTPVTDAGLEHLRGLTQLKELDVASTPITDAGLVHLRGLARLQKLNLNNTPVTDAGLEHLRGLTQLRDLDLTGTRVTDDGLKQLGGLTRLQLLRLDKTEVTGTGLVDLRGLTQLESLCLDGLKADAAAVRRFKRERPRVRIEPWVLVWGWDVPGRDADVRLTPTTKKILSALWGDTRLVFMETPLKDVVAFLRDQHDIPIQLDEPRLRAARISTDMPVTRNIKGFPLRSALRWILIPKGLTYIIGEEALIITTAEEGQRLARQGMIGADEVSREFQKNGKVVWVLQDEVRLQFSATPLEDAVDFLERQHGISIGIDTRELAAAGIRPDVRCTLNVKDVPLASALRKLLADVGLSYVVDDEFITITTPKKDAPADTPTDPSASPKAGKPD